MPRAARDRRGGRQTRSWTRSSPSPSAPRSSCRSGPARTSSTSSETEPAALTDAIARCAPSSLVVVTDAHVQRDRHASLEAALAPLGDPPHDGDPARRRGAQDARLGRDDLGRRARRRRRSRRDRRSASAGASWATSPASQPRRSCVGCARSSCRRRSSRWSTLPSAGRPDSITRRERTSSARFISRAASSSTSPTSRRCSARERTAGLAEVVKIALAVDAPLLDAARAQSRRDRRWGTQRARSGRPARGRGEGPDRARRRARGGPARAPESRVTRWGTRSRRRGAIASIFTARPSRSERSRSSAREPDLGWTPAPLVERVRDVARSRSGFRPVCRVQRSPARSPSSARTRSESRRGSGCRSCDSPGRGDCGAGRRFEAFCEAVLVPPAE